VSRRQKRGYTLRFPAGRGLELGARLAGLRLQALEVRGPDKLEWAFAELTRGRVEALIVLGPAPVRWCGHHRPEGVGCAYPQY
jgi:hypothetical protein